MTNENPKYNQVNALIEEVRTKISEIAALPINNNYEGSNPEDPKKDLYRFIEYFNNLFPFGESVVPKVYSSRVYDDLIIKFNNALTELSNIENKIKNGEKIKVILPDLIKIIDQIKIENYKIEYSPKLNSEENLRYIYKKITQSGIPFDSKQKIIDFINYSKEKDNDIVLKLIDIYNKIVESDEPNKVTNEVKFIERDINDILYFKIIDQLDEELSSLKTASNQVRENIELEKNDPLITVYRTFSKQQNRPILFLSLAIYFIFFLIIIFLYCSFLTSNLTTNDFCFGMYIFYFPVYKEFSLENYLLHIPVYIAISALLAFLIKERNRRLNIQNYCDKTWLELSALPAYMTEFSKEERIKLRSALAEKYFSGPYGDVSKVEVNNDLNPNVIIELTKALKDFKGK